MEAPLLSEILALANESTRRHIPEDYLQDITAGTSSPSILFNDVANSQDYTASMLDK
jgi:hypothetical protein